MHTAIHKKQTPHRKIKLAFIAVDANINGHILDICLAGSGFWNSFHSLLTGKRLICQPRQMGVPISKLVDHVIESIKPRYSHWKV